MKKINVKSIVAYIKNELSYRMEGFTWLKAAQFFLAIFAVSNMVWNDIYNDALLKMENEVVGFIMFCFVLCGVISMVFAIRIVPGKKSTVIVSLLSIVLTMAFALYMIYLMQYALTYQTSMTTSAIPVVKKGMRFGIAMCVGYFLSLLAIGLTGFRKPVKLY